jgi:hypothetical protein
MTLDEMITQMTWQAELIRMMVDGVDDEQARWKPDAESWSILEVVNHLYDEEREDFRLRLDYLLHQPAIVAPPIDPQAWVTERAYNQRDLAQSLDNFLAERQRSLDWLRGLDAPDFTAEIVMPWGAIYHPGDMAAAWLSHDLLHLRQLVELHWAWTQRVVAPYQSDYAGAW